MTKQELKDQWEKELILKRGTVAELTTEINMMVQFIYDLEDLKEDATNDIRRNQTKG